MMSGSSSQERASSKVFQPLTIANGNITLSHRIVMAPMTRNRGAPLNLTVPNRMWAPDALAVQYYSQRSTPGGLIITEGIPPNLEGNGVPGVPGLFHPAQIPGWRAIVSAVHDRGGYIYAQLWHAGRCTLPQFTGCPAALSASATPFDGDDEARYPPPDATGNPGSGPRVKYRDFPPAEMSVVQIQQTIADFVATARRAVDECGFDGIEVHGGNGYLVEQFLSTNINNRTDDYGGSVAGYCRFGLELVEALAQAVGGSNVAIRLTPFGLFNQAKGEKRLEIWSHFCRELKVKVPDLSYVHFIEPVSVS
jgi:2,4-dienoyl-CoA reductase-like NADH-dependent reductase (Old Yellow Enzyme family)